MKLHVGPGWISAVMVLWALLLHAGAQQAGSFDTTFRPAITGSSDVVSLLVAEDGSVYSGGVTGIAVEGLRRSITKFHPDGTLDTSFAAGRGQGIGEPLSMALDPQGRLLVAARRYRSDLGRSEGVVWRLLPSGEIDPSFGPVIPSPTMQGDVRVVKVDGSGHIYIGSDFPAFKDGSRKEPFNGVWLAGKEEGLGTTLHGQPRAVQVTIAD